MIPFMAATTPPGTWSISKQGEVGRVENITSMDTPFHCLMYRYHQYRSDLSPGLGESNYLDHFVSAHSWSIFSRRYVQGWPPWKHGLVRQWGIALIVLSTQLGAPSDDATYHPEDAWSWLKYPGECPKMTVRSCDLQSSPLPDTLSGCCKHSGEDGCPKVRKSSM